MRAREIITTHSNTDFDAFAAMVAAGKLYPEARLVLSGSVNRNVREFQALYADLVPVADAGDLDLDEVKRLVLVDTVHPNRIGELAPLCERPDVQVIAFDHHALDEEMPAFIAPENLVSAPTGSLVTLLVRIIAERGIAVTPFEATLFAIGIHEDTGSLTFSTTTVADAEALAFCMRHGADPTLLEKWLGNELTEGQRRTLAGALERAEDLGIEGVEAYLAALHEDLYVEGVSVVAHRFMDLTGCDAFFLLVEMEHRVFVTARSRGGRVDVAEALAAVGGGGHFAAASAVVKDRPMDEVRRELAAAAAAAVRPVAVAADALREGLFATALDDTVDAAALSCRRLGVDGLAVVDDAALVGMVALADLDRATAHGLGHAPVKAVMMSRVPVVSRETTLEDAARVIARQPIGWVPVVQARATGESVSRADVVGMLGRAEVAGGRPAADEHAVEPAGNLAARLAGLGLDDLFTHVQSVATEVRGVVPRRRRRPRPAPRRELVRHRPRRRGRRHRFCADPGGQAQRARAAAREVRHRRGRGTGAGTGRRLPAHRRRFDSFRVLRLPGSAAQGRARRHPQRPGAAGLHHQRDGRLSQAGVVRRSARLLRRPRRPRGASPRRPAQPELHRGPHEDPARRSLRESLRAAHGRAHPQPGSRGRRHGPDRRPLVGAPA